MSKLYIKLRAVSGSRSRDFKLADFGRAILGFAMDANDFFHFANLQTYFPQLARASQFVTSDKGDQLRPQDDWKQDFLAQVKAKARLETVFQGRDYAVLGLPFFNETGQTNTDFKAAFEDQAIEA